MTIERSKEWWLKRIENEPDCTIGAGVPERHAKNWPSWALSVRAQFAWLWRIGIIKRTTAFRWEMDRALGEKS